MGEAPASLDDVTPGWLADVLGLPIAGVEVEIIGQGEGFMGQLARARLRFDTTPPADAPASVIVKLPTLDPGGRNVGMMMGVWERDARFYEQLAPLLGVRVPAVHFNHSDAETGSYALIMEDLAPMRAADQVRGATPDQARRIIDELAALHGAWWEHPLLPTLEWLPGLDSPMVGAIKPMFDMGWPQFVARYEHRVPPRTMRWAETFSNEVPTLLARYLGEPNTLVHGDFRLDNIFFDAAGNAGGDFALVDWQMAMRSPGGSDLVYFIVTNLTPDLRRVMERELVERYQRGLVAAGVQGSYATVERLWQGYLEGVLFYTVTFGGGLFGIDPANERGVTLFDELVMRTFTAAGDLAVGEVLGLDGARS